MSVSIEVREDFEKALRFFKRKVQKSGLLSEVRARRFHEKPSAKKKHKRQRAMKKRQREILRYFK